MSLQWGRADLHGAQVEPVNEAPLDCELGSSVPTVLQGMAPVSVKSIFKILNSFLKILTRTLKN